MSQVAYCPAHAATYPWMQDCPDCVKDARARGLSIGRYYDTVRPWLRPDVSPPAGGNVEGEKGCPPTTA